MEGEGESEGWPKTLLQAARAWKEGKRPASVSGVSAVRPFCTEVERVLACHHEARVLHVILQQAQ